MAVLPPPYTATRRPITGRPPAATVCRNDTASSDPAGVPGRDVDPLGQVRADGHEDRVEAAVPPLGGDVLDPVVQREPHAESGDPGHLAVEDVARQPVRRDAVAHHAARLTERVTYLDLVSPHRQVVCRGQAAGAGTDDQHPLAGAGSRRIVAPPLGEGEVAEEALRPRGWRRRCRAGSGCSWSRTGGSRPGRGSPAAGCPGPAAARPARTGRPSGARARPGRSPRRDRRRCTAEAGRRRPVGSAGPDRYGRRRAGDPAAG